MVWVFLVGAIASEVVGTLALRGSEGFSRLGPSVVVVLGYVLSFALLAQALKGIGIGQAYAVWSGVGTVGVSVGGALLFADRLTPVAVAGIALVVAGVVLVNLGGEAHG